MSKTITVKNINENLKEVVLIMYGYYKKLDGIESDINYIERLKKHNLHNPITCAEEMKKLSKEKTEIENHIKECLEALKQK